MSKEELIRELKELRELNDPESAHVIADELIIKYINDSEIKEAFEDIKKWYA